MILQFEEFKHFGKDKDYKILHTFHEGSRVDYIGNPKQGVQKVRVDYVRVIFKKK